MTLTLIKTAFIASSAVLLIAAGPKADLNQDGQVTIAEFIETAQTRFYALDTNTDGFLSLDEQTAGKDNLREGIKNKRSQNGDHSLSRDEINVTDTQKKVNQDERRQKLMEKFDTNDDGLISFDEHMAVTEQLFLRLDANDDGVLTKGEGRKRKNNHGKKRED